MLSSCKGTLSLVPRCSLGNKAKEHSIHKSYLENLLPPSTLLSFGNHPQKLAALYSRLHNTLQRSATDIEKDSMQKVLHQ